MAKLSLLPPAEVATLARSLADPGVAVTVLPTMDLFLMVRNRDHSAVRGVADANLLIKYGVNCLRRIPDRLECSLSSNNILNPATPYGDCLLIRIANLYANVLQVDRSAELCECFGMLTDMSAWLLNLKDYGFAVGHTADVAVIGAQAGDRRNLPAARGIQERQADGGVAPARASSPTLTVTPPCRSLAA